MPSEPTATEIERLVQIARDAAQAASAQLLRRFRAPLESSVKADGSLVTEADHAAERAILDVLRAADPDASVLTEESGSLDGDASARWVIDPLDGTSRFARGHRSWGPLIAREQDGRVVACALALPAMEESYWAGLGLGAWGNGSRLRVSSVGVWAEAIFAMGALPRLLQTPAASGVTTLARTCSYASAGGDLMGATLVASGRAEVWLECGVQPWDIAPMGLLVTEAGGKATDLTGDARLGPGSAMLVSNGALHDEALGALAAG